MASKVLVAYASKHGSTAEIAEVIADSLRSAGLVADVQPAHYVQSLEGYDAVVVGSVVQMFHWQRDAVALLKRFEPELRGRPTWLFSSGPTGGSEKADLEVARAKASPEEFPAPKDIERYAVRIGARGHVTFPGKVGTGVGGVFARWVPTGDWRDFSAIMAWAREIAASLTAEAVSTG